MLADLGCNYVICGHSERRQAMGEDDELVRAKASAALNNGLTAIVCLGESEAARDAGEAQSVVEKQLTGSLPDGATGANLVIAYEPVWAIGTGRTAGEGEISEIHGLIRRILTSELGEAVAGSVRILYGGSVKPDNAAQILGLKDVDGALVGGASLKAEDFYAIAQTCP
jgi:triosephosphate isomerase